MSNFYARTRLIGELEYYRAAWIDGCYGGHKYGVRFEEGPHAGRVYPEFKCKIAKEEYQQRSPISDEDIRKIMEDQK